MEKVFGRVQSPWLPASGDETHEIIRRRLFQPLDSEGEGARDETVKAFAEMYRKNAAEFPPEAKEKRYEELLRLSYPIHPELFDRLSKDWATLDKFQRTRGVLRFLANVVGVLWHSETRDPLITPARVPIAHERVCASGSILSIPRSARSLLARSTATVRCLAVWRQTRRAVYRSCGPRPGRRVLSSSAQRRSSANPITA
jgi:uncharacterized protein DUF499